MSLGPARDDQRRQRKIDGYVIQADLLTPVEQTPLIATRFKAFYRYRCHDAACGGHRQGVLDWELVEHDLAAEQFDAVGDLITLGPWDYLNHGPRLSSTPGPSRMRSGRPSGPDCRTQSALAAANDRRW